jgi:hypothetical protein
VRDDELRNHLNASNPWWLATDRKTSPNAWASSHRLLTARARSDLGYRADVLDDIAQGPMTDRLVVLTGPRRVVPSTAGRSWTTPMESNWVGTGWRSEARVIEGKHAAGVVATKNILNLDNPSWAVPAPLVALLLG